MRKRKFLQGLLAVMIYSGWVIPDTASAKDFKDVESQNKILTIEQVNPELSTDEIVRSIKEYAASEGFTESESLELFYKEALAQQREQDSNIITINSSTKPNQAPGPARHKGDIMYSKAWTGINHGHVAIYYTTKTVVHAPGIGEKSRAESANNKIGLKNGIQLLEVKTSQSNRDKAANRAYNKYRNKPYNINFIMNKSNEDKLNCSSLVWFSYKKGASIDLDANGGPGVYPSDIRDSSLTKKYDDK